MNGATEADRCIKTESTVDGLSVYVVVVMHGGCPVEVQVSVAGATTAADQRAVDSTTKNVATLEMLVNYSLSSGLPVEPLIVLLLKPPSKYSKIIGLALIASMEG